MHSPALQVQGVLRVRRKRSPISPTSACAVVLSGSPRIGTSSGWRRGSASTRSRSLLVGTGPRRLPWLSVACQFATACAGSEAVSPGASCCSLSNSAKF